MLRFNMKGNGEEHSDEQLLDMLAKVQLPNTSLTDMVYEKGENLSDDEKQHLFVQAAEDTLPLICHRLTGLEEMDQIVVMDQGRVVEIGSYSELMDQKGYFYEMKKIERQMIGEI